MMNFKLTTTTAPAVELTVVPADRMRAERLSTKVLPPSQRGAEAPKTHAQTWVLLWLYCAALRNNLTTPDTDFESWADTVVDYDRVTDDDDTADQLGAVAGVGPTQPTEGTQSP